MNFFAVYVDAVIFRFFNEKIQVRLAYRASDAERLPGVLALEGVLVNSFKDDNEISALNRLFFEKIRLIPSYFEQLNVSCGKDRDPNGFSMSVPFLVLVESTSNDEHGIWKDVDDILSKDDSFLPFDHVALIKAAYEALYNKSGYTDLPLKLLDQPFRFSDIRKVFETVLNVEFQRSIIKRRILPNLNIASLPEDELNKRDAAKYIRKTNELVYFKNVSKAV